MLDQLKEKLKKDEYKNYKNIKIIRADASKKLPFKDNMFDLVFLVDVLQEIPKHNRTLKELFRIIKQGGTLAISEYFMDPDFVFKSQTVNECEEAGFDKIKSFGNPLHYTVRFAKQ